MKKIFIFTLLVVLTVSIFTSLIIVPAGLATVVRGYVDKPALEKKMGLGPEQKVNLCQSVGYPKK